MDDLRASREIAREIGRGRDLVIATVNTGNWQAHYEGAQPAIETVLEAISLAERFGYAPLANAMRHMSCQFLIDAGHLDEAVEMLAMARSRQAEPMPTTAEHRIQALRGQEAEALAGAARIEQEVLPQAGIDDERVVIRTPIDGDPCLLRASRGRAPGPGGRAGHRTPCRYRELRGSGPANTHSRGLQRGSDRPRRADPGRGCPSPVPVLSPCPCRCQGPRRGTRRAGWRTRSRDSATRRTAGLPLPPPSRRHMPGSAMPAA